MRFVFSILFMGLAIYSGIVSAQAVFSSQEQSIIAPYMAKHGAPFSVSRGTYNNGLLVVKFTEEPNTIITLTIFGNGRFRVTRHAETPDTEDTQAPAADAADASPDDSADDTADDAAPE